MFFDKEGNSITLLKERISDFILARKNITRFQFNTIVHQLVDAKYLKETKTTLIPLEKTIDYLKEKTLGIKIKEWIIKNWILCGIVSWIFIYIAGIFSAVFIEITKSAILDNKQDSILIKTQTIYVNDTIYLDSSKPIQQGHDTIKLK